MPLRLTQEQIIFHIERLLSGEWDQQAFNHLHNEIRASVPCPEAQITDIIFNREGLTPTQMAEAMYSYRPIQISNE